VIVNLPPPPVTYTPGGMSPLFDAIRRAFSAAVSRNEAVNRLMLQSPDGKTWQVTVDNTGTLVVAANDGKTRDI